MASEGVHASDESDGNDGTGATTSTATTTSSRTSDARPDPDALQNPDPEPRGDAVAAAQAAGPSNGESVRIDSWIWSVRLVKTRSMGAAACKGGHVRVNGERVKPAHSVRVGDEVRLRHEGRERIVVVKRVIRKRVGPPVAAECFVDNSPPPPPRETVAPAGIRDRGTGRPTKRDRRELERLRDLPAAGSPDDAPDPHRGARGTARHNTRRGTQR